MKFLSPRIPLREKLFFAEHLAVMLRSSIALDRALSSLQEQTTNRAFKTILTAIREKIQKGEALSAALQPFERIFGEFFISIIKAGEYAGKLDDALRRLYEQMKKDYELRATIKSALAYPAFVVVAMIGIGGAIMMFVVPKLIPLFEGFNAQLPLATRMLIAFSKFLSHYAILLILTLIAFGFLFIKLIRGRLRGLWHALLLRLPGVGGFIKKVNLARFSRTLSTLLATDILVVEALAITAKVVGNEQYKNALLRASDTVKQGVSIASALKTYPTLFPATAETMIAVGEETGALSDLLKEVAVFYEEGVDEATRSISSIIEPALIVMLGVAVGGIALAILTPMYSLIDQI